MKKSIFKALSLFLAVIAISTMMSACTKDEPAELLYYDFATLDGVQEGVGSSATVLRPKDLSPVHLLFPNQYIDTKKFPVNSRILIAYVPEDGQAYQSGNATLYGVGYVYNGKVTEGTSDETDSWATNMQNLWTISLTGSWLNFQTECTYSNEYPQTYAVVVDETTLDSEYPELHVIYEPSTTVDARTQLFYASFDVSSVMDNDNVKGIKVFVMETVGPKTYTFEK